MSERSRLIIDEPALQVLPTLAEKIGLNEAMVLQQVHYWADIHQRADNESYYENGRWWAANSNGDWHEQFPFWSKRTVRRTLKSLVDDGLLVVQIKGEPGRQVKWYAVDHAELKKLEDDIEPDGGKSDHGGGSDDDGGGQDVDPPGGHDVQGDPNARDQETVKKETVKETDGAERTPTPEDHEPETTTSDDTADLRDLVETKLGAKAKSLNCPLTDSDIDTIVERIDDCDVPPDAYERYLNREASRIRSGSGLRDFPGDDESVDKFFDANPDIERDAPLAERCVSRGPSGRLHHESPGDREKYAEELEPSKTLDWGETDDTEVAS